MLIIRSKHSHPILTHGVWIRPGTNLYTKEVHTAVAAYKSLKAEDTTDSFSAEIVPAANVNDFSYGDSPHSGGEI